MHLKLFQKEQFKKQQKQPGDLIGNKITDKITGVSRTFPKNNPETSEEEILRERFIASELSHNFIDDLRLRKENY